MKLLVVGGGGFVGSNLVEYLRTKHQITATYDTNYRTRFCGVEWVHMKASDHSCIKQIVDRVAPDVVINAAGYKDVLGCETHPNIAFQSNVAIVANIASACRAARCRFVHISTDLVFDGRSAPYTEHCVPSPKGVYGYTKLAAEHISRICDDTLIIRTGGLYGRGHALLTKAQTELSLKQRMFGFTNASNTPTYIGNLALAINHLLCGDVGVYHVADTTTASRYELLATYAMVLGYDQALVEPALSPPALMLPFDVSLHSIFATPHMTTLLGGLQKFKEDLSHELH